MTRSPLVLIIFLIVFFSAGAALKFYFFPNQSIGYNPFVNFQSWSVRQLSSLNSFLITLARIRYLVQENENLKTENLRLLGQTASIDAIENENIFLRRALSIATELKTKPIPAGLFDVIMAPDGQWALVSKGSNFGLEKGDIVISAEGILIGQVADVFSNYSRARLVSDPHFSVNGKVLKGKTSGVAKGTLGEDMVFTLVVQTDEIQEGDIVVSNGSDFFPPGLIIGTVKSVQASDTSLFKKVVISPAARGADISKVLVIRGR